MRDSETTHFFLFIDGLLQESTKLPNHFLLPSQQKMTSLSVNTDSHEDIIQSFDNIAKTLFNDFQLQVNSTTYRLIDIEFYYFSKETFEDVYAHKHHEQLKNGKWYFHGSGIDLTFGNDVNHGGILIRAIAKIANNHGKDRNFISEEIHGPVNVKTEICSNFNGAFENEPNLFQLIDISTDRKKALMVPPSYIIKSKRIGLNPKKEVTVNFHPLKLRYVIFPSLKLRDKTQIALDMHEQFPEMTIAQINRELGSTFLK